jgi:hypothetical protein
LIQKAVLLVAVKAEDEKEVKHRQWRKLITTYPRYRNKKRYVNEEYTIRGNHRREKKKLNDAYLKKKCVQRTEA